MVTKQQPQMSVKEIEYQRDVLARAMKLLKKYGVKITMPNGDVTRYDMRKCIAEVCRLASSQIERRGD